MPIPYPPLLVDAAEILSLAPWQALWAAAVLVGCVPILLGPSPYARMATIALLAAFVALPTARLLFLAIETAILASAGVGRLVNGRRHRPRPY